LTFFGSTFFAVSQIGLTGIFSGDVIDIRRSVEVLPDAVADKNGHDAESEFLRVAENLGSYASKWPTRPAGLDPDVEAVLGDLFQQVNM